MSLVITNKSALYGGVNQQSAMHRQDTQVEEMSNGYPTLSQGLMKRNPTEILKLADSVNFSYDMWAYEYDRGLSGSSEEKYSIQISKDGMQIINVSSGKVYNEANGLLTFEDSAYDYLFPYTNYRGYSAITIKDTTFIANKNVQPLLDPYTFGSTTDSTTEDITVYKTTSTFLTTPLNNSSFSIQNSIEYDDWGETTTPISYTTLNKEDFAPTRLVTEYTEGHLYDIYLAGSTTNVIVDGILIQTQIDSVKIAEDTTSYDGGLTFFNLSTDNLEDYTFDSYDEYITNVYVNVSGFLDSSIYSVGLIETSGQKHITITRLDGENPEVYVSLTLNEISDETSVLWDAVESDYYVETTTTSEVETITTPATDYEQQAFLWISSSEPEYGYDYSYVITSDNYSISGTVIDYTNTEDAAEAIKDDINAQSGFTAVQSGNIIKVVTSDGSAITNVYMTDTYGDEASFGWSMEVQYLEDLPKTMPYECLVQVVDIENSENSYGYWLEYLDGVWQESLGLDTQPKLDSTTMPHIITRNSDDTFTVSAYDEWDDMKSEIVTLILLLVF